MFILIDTAMNRAALYTDEGILVKYDDKYLDHFSFPLNVFQSYCIDRKTKEQLTMMGYIRIPYSGLAEKLWEV